jgi:hypothetical protein
MSQPGPTPRTDPSRPITTEDLRRKAVHVQDLAKAEVRDVVELDTTRMVVAGVAVVAVALSLAYFMGTAAGRRRAQRAARRSAEKVAKAAARAAGA